MKGIMSISQMNTFPRELNKSTYFTKFAFPHSSMLSFIFLSPLPTPPPQLWGTPTFFPTCLWQIWDSQHTSPPTYLPMHLWVWGLVSESISHQRLFPEQLGYLNNSCGTECYIDTLWGMCVRETYLRVRNQGRPSEGCNIWTENWRMSKKGWPWREEEHRDMSSRQR